MVSIKLVYSVSRYWRCFFLLLVASVLSFFLIYISKNDPNLEHYFPYFRGGSKYNFYYSHTNIEEVNNLMEKNYLDYEFMNSNSRYCLKKSIEQNQVDSEHKKSHESINILNEDFHVDEMNSNTQLEFILLSISQAHHFKYRSAARSTWAKFLPSADAKLIFFIGDPFYDTTNSKVIQRKFNENDREKLKTEMKNYNDIVQINMADNENYTSTKSLIAIRWALTYCTFAKNVFVLSDSAILNHKKFEQFVKSGSKVLDDQSVAGLCHQTDEKLAYVLQYFFTNLHKNSGSNSRPKQALFTSRVKENKTLDVSSKSQTTAPDLEIYKGQFCSNLGFMLTMNAARQLWVTSLRTPYMLKMSPAYLTGFLVFRANFTPKNVLRYNDFVPIKTNCLSVFEKETDILLCAENFTLPSRYTSYIASWNSPGQSQLGIMIKH